MKKYRLLMLSAALFIVCFLVGWYGDLLSGSPFFLFMPLLVLLLFACFIVLLVLCTIRIVKHKAYFEFVSLAVLTLLAFLTLFFPYREAKLQFDLNRCENDRIKIVEQIQSGELQSSDGIGNVVLPFGYKRLSASGEVFQYQNDENGQVIGFYIFRGLAVTGSVKLVYSSGGEELIRANAHYIEELTPLKEHWYYMVTD